MNEVIMSGVLAVSSVAGVALSWRTPSSRRLIIVLAILANLLAAAAMPREAVEARLLSWSIGGTLIAIGVLTSSRAHWRGMSPILWTLAGCLLGVFYFLRDAPPLVGRGALIALCVTAGLAVVTSLILIRRLVEDDSAQKM